MDIDELWNNNKIMKFRLWDIEIKEFSEYIEISNCVILWENCDDKIDFLLHKYTYKFIIDIDNDDFIGWDEDIFIDIRENEIHFNEFILLIICIEIIDLFEFIEILLD